MNKERRQTIANAITNLESALGLLEMARDEEQEYFDMMPENMQGGDKGDQVLETIDRLQEAVDSAEQAIEVGNSI